MFSHYFRSLPFVAVVRQNSRKPPLAHLAEDERDNNFWQVLKYPPCQILCFGRRRGQYKAPYRATTLSPLLWDQCPDARWLRGRPCASSHHGKARAKHVSKSPQCQPVNWDQNIWRFLVCNELASLNWIPRKRAKTDGTSHPAPACAIKEVQYSLQLLTWSTQHFPIYVINFTNLSTNTYRPLYVCHLNDKDTALKRLPQEWCTSLGSPRWWLF